MTYQNETLGLTVSPRLRESLNAAATWARLIAIISFINLAISFLLAIFQGNVFSSLVMTAIQILINMYLLNFGRKVKAALNANSQEEFNEGLNNLRMYFKVSGIVIIVGISLVVIGILIGGAALLTRM